VDGDNGVAVYFTWKNNQYVLACDTYYTMAENLRAIEKSIEAIRGLERWGASDILARAFSGFKALNSAPVEAPYTILDLSENCSRDEINSAYRKLAKKFHPDNRETGDQQKFIKIKEAYDQLI